VPWGELERRAKGRPEPPALQILVEVAIIQAFILEVRCGVSFLDNRNSSRVSRSLASGVRTSQEGSGVGKGGRNLTTQTVCPLAVPAPLPKVIGCSLRTGWPDPPCSIDEAKGKKVNIPSPCLPLLRPGQPIPSAA